MKTHSFKSQAGISLIEIMIALLIGVFLLGGLMQMFVASKETYKLQDAVSRLQENGRFAMDFLVRDIRGSGSWGCFSNTVNITSLLNSNGIFTSFATGIEGLDNNNSYTGTSIQDSNNDGIIDGTDVISLRSTATLQDPAGNDILIKQIPSSTSADLKVSSNSGITEGDILFISDCVDGNLFQSTNVNTAGSFDNIVHNTGNTQTPGNSSQSFTKIYDTSARLYKASFDNYSIRLGEGGQPALFKTENGGAAQELIEGIENMQILYGEDLDGDGTPNRYLPATTAVNMSQVVSVSISLLVRSLQDNLADVPIAYTYNGQTITPTDRRIRRVFSSVITIRNRLI